jgi:hypothetical protein
MGLHPLSVTALLLLASLVTVMATLRPRASRPRAARVPVPVDRRRRSARWPRPR